MGTATLTKDEASELIVLERSLCAADINVREIEAVKKTNPGDAL